MLLITENKHGSIINRNKLIIYLLEKTMKLSVNLIWKQKNLNLKLKKFNNQQKLSFKIFCLMIIMFLVCYFGEKMMKFKSNQ